MSFSRSDVSAKKHMARVSDLYRERVRSIKTVLFFIVSASLLSGETVPTCIPGICLPHFALHTLVKGDRIRIRVI